MPVTPLMYWSYPTYHARALSAKGIRAVVLNPGKESGGLAEAREGTARSAALAGSHPALLYGDLSNKDRGAAGFQSLVSWAAGGECRISLLAQAMKYFMFERSSWPPSCWRQASAPPSNPVFTGGIWATR